jgi:VanZ family protein
MRSSPLARATALAYALLLAYSGLAPWSGWHDLGLDPLVWLAAPIPRYVTRFDLIVNVLAYVPLGALIVLALHPRIRGVLAVVIALLVAAALAAGVETGQTFLPTRVASNIDLATNSLGALIGASLAAPLASKLIDGGRLLELRLRWFERDASVLLLIVALWPAAQIHPGPMLFGNGDMQAPGATVAEAFGFTWFTIDATLFGPAEFVLAEALVVAAAVLAVGLVLASVMRPAIPRVALLAALIAAALAAKSLASAVQFGPEHALAWLTPGAVGGLAIGVLSLAVASSGARRALRAFALLAVLVLLVAVNIVPENPYYLANLAEWRQGRLLNFNALARWLSLAWPLVLLAWLAGRQGRD